MGDGEHEVRPTAKRPPRPLATSFDAGWIGCLSLLVLASGALTAGVLPDSEDKVTSGLWQAAIGVAGFLLALAILVGVRPLAMPRGSGTSGEDPRPPDEPSPP